GGKQGLGGTVSGPVSDHRRDDADRGAHAARTRCVTYTAQEKSTFSRTPLVEKSKRKKLAAIPELTSIRYRPVVRRARPRLPEPARRPERPARRIAGRRRPATGFPGQQTSRWEAWQHPLPASCHSTSASILSPTPGSWSSSRQTTTKWSCRVSLW